MPGSLQRSMKSLFARNGVMGVMKHAPQALEASPLWGLNEAGIQALAKPIDAFIYRLSLGTLGRLPGL